jgi:hypothetical protein
MAKKAGSRKKRTAAKGRKGAVRAKRLRKPTRSECLALGIFKGHSLASVFNPEFGCDTAIKRRWASYLRKKG